MINNNNNTNNKFPPLPLLPFECKLVHVKTQIGRGTGTLISNNWYSQPEQIFNNIGLNARRYSYVWTRIRWKNYRGRERERARRQYLYNSRHFPPVIRPEKQARRIQQWGTELQIVQLTHDILIIGLLFHHLRTVTAIDVHQLTIILQFV